MGDEYFFTINGVAIGSAEFTDADLVPFGELSEIRTLRLVNTHVSDAGLEKLRNLTSLTTLELRRSDITDDGLRHLKRFSRLQDLTLTDTGVTDTGLSYISHLQLLERLRIGKYNIQGAKEQPVSEITDAGLSHIARLKNLKQLVLHNTKVTPEGIEKLRGALPTLTIENSNASTTNRRGIRFIRGENRWEPEETLNDR